MKENMRFSIIIPVYNSEKYLRECLNSVINQTYRNLEIICVNDGSTDNSLKILEEYAKKDERIKIISQENQGQGTARNTGIDNATGDYISFVDADDWIELDMYEKLAEYLEVHKSKVLQFFYQVYYQGNNLYDKELLLKTAKKKFCLDLENLNSYSLKTFDKKYLLKFKSSSVDKIYLASFIKNNNIRFPACGNGEDTMFFFKVLFNTDKVDLIKQYFYTYRKHSNSSTTSNTTRNTLYIFEQIDWIKELLEQKGLFDDFKKEFKAYKLRAIYEGDKYLLPELKQEFEIKTKEYLTKNEYCKYFVKKHVSMFLRNVFSIRKVYVNDKPRKIVRILGLDLGFRVKGK